EIAGIPVALIGMVGYSLLLVLNAAAYSADPAETYRPLLALIFLGALAGTLFSAYLTYVELFVLRAICPWCVVSALIITALLILSAVALRPLGLRAESSSPV
ncbi:MAG: vitamin K epoxide reductase family protein, partial [Anaerolineae bacterium]